MNDFTMFAFDGLGRAEGARTRRKGARNVAKVRMCGCSITRIGKRPAARCPIPGVRQSGRKGYMYKFLRRGHSAPACMMMPVLKGGARRGRKVCAKKVRGAVWRACHKRVSGR